MEYIIRQYECANKIWIEMNSSFIDEIVFQAVSVSQSSSPMTASLVLKIIS
jgi:hypothetical protein